MTAPWPGIQPPTASSGFTPSGSLPGSTRTPSRCRCNGAPEADGPRPSPPVASASATSRRRRWPASTCSPSASNSHRRMISDPSSARTSAVFGTARQVLKLVGAGLEIVEKVGVARATLQLPATPSPHRRHPRHRGHTPNVGVGRPGTLPRATSGGLRVRSPLRVRRRRLPGGLPIAHRGVPRPHGPLLPPPLGAHHLHDGAPRPGGGGRLRAPGVGVARRVRLVRREAGGPPRRPARRAG